MDKVKLLYEKYCEMLRYMPEVKPMTQERFSARIPVWLEKLSCVEDEGGFLYYDLTRSGDRCSCRIPLYGCCADQEKTAVKLFQRLAQRVSAEGTCDYQVHLFRHDEEVLNAFRMMQFCTMSEKCIKPLRDPCGQNSPGIVIRPVLKDELARRWQEVWKAVRQILLHLQESPVFYPCNEFTEEVYKQFLFSDDTEVIAAFDGDHIVGIIEWNKESDTFIGGEHSVNVGEIYVYPSYRDKKLSKALLAAAESRAKAAGYDYMWVEHGTANPNARGFWNRYFEPYEYVLVRTIVPVR